MNRELGRAFIKVTTRVVGGYMRDVYVNVDHITTIQYTGGDRGSWIVGLTDGESLIVANICNPLFELERVPGMRVGK